MKTKNWVACDQTGGPFANYVYGVMTPGNFVRSTNNGASFENTFAAVNFLPGMMVCVGANVLGGNIPGGASTLLQIRGIRSMPLILFTDRPMED